MEGSWNSDSILDVRKKHFLSTAAHYYKTPLQLVKAKGAYVFDEKGREYLDAIGGIVCISAGHNHPKIKEALLRMLESDEIQHTTLLYLNHHATDLATELLKEAPKRTDRVFFTNSGSEANELAMMAARTATGETIIMSVRHGYHGGTSGTLSICGHHNWRFRSQPVAQVTSVAEPYCYRCPFGKTPNSCALECASSVESTIQTTTHGKIAGFIAEPILGVGGFITPPKEYFLKVSEIVHRYGGLYISDEVQTGAGRCGDDFLLTNTYGVDADIVTMAKGFGNGAAIGATLMTSEASNSLSGKLHFNTFGSDPYQTEQARVTLQIIREEKLIQNAKLIGNYLHENFKALQNRHPLIGEVRGRGLLIGLELVSDRTTKAYATSETATLMEWCREKGLLVGKGGLFGNVIRLAPPLSIQMKEADFILKVFDEGLNHIERGKT